MIQRYIRDMITEAEEYADERDYDMIYIKHDTYIYFEFYNSPLYHSFAVEIEYIDYDLTRNLIDKAFIERLS